MVSICTAYFNTKISALRSQSTFLGYVWITEQTVVTFLSLCQWPRGLRRGSVAARLLGLYVRFPPRAFMSFCCECCVLSGRGLCVGLITRPEESYQVCCVWVWSWSHDSEKALAHWGPLRLGRKSPWQVIVVDKGIFSVRRKDKILDLLD